MSLKGEVLPYILKQQISRQNKIAEKQQLKARNFPDRLSLSRHDDDLDNEDEETHSKFILINFVAQQCH
jgi:hypothetical protein